MYGRPWAHIWEKYWEQGMQRAESDDIFDFERERRIDPDLWVLEIEDRGGWNPFAEEAS